MSANRAGSTSATWTPSQARSWTIDGGGKFAGASEFQFVVAALPTITTFYVANRAEENVPMSQAAALSSMAGTALGSAILLQMNARVAVGAYGHSQVRPRVCPPAEIA